jgi:hypothetical protein
MPKTMRIAITVENDTPVAYVQQPVELGLPLPAGAAKGHTISSVRQRFLAAEQPRHPHEP